MESLELVEVAWNHGSLRKLTSSSPPLTVASSPPATRTFFQHAKQFSHFKILDLLFLLRGIHLSTLFPWLAPFQSSHPSLYITILKGSFLSVISEPHFLPPLRIFSARHRKDDLTVRTMAPNCRHVMMALENNVATSAELSAASAFPGNVTATAATELALRGPCFFVSLVPSI